jgi:alpha-L-fucosidase
MSKAKSINIHRKDPPQWFRESDFGIFIHWGLYSVPAYAPTEIEDFGTIIQKGSFEYLFKNQPYAEWYKNSIGIEGSYAQKYHNEHYGGMPYEKFADTFRETAKNVDPDEWAEYFSKAGAKYVVLVSKHHDGFVMFNSAQENPNIKNYMLDFDFAGDLAKACRKRGMRYGIYYSSLLDWTFTDKPIRSAADLMLGNDNSRRYMDYCYNHWLEIIERYRPDILWSDIGYPQDSRLENIFTKYYETVPEGMVNDRWVQFPNWMRNPLCKAIFNSMVKRKLKSGSTDLGEVKYYDYRTIEYTSEWKENDIWFEMCRGMDKSFAYNKYSRKEDHITADEVRQLIAELYPKKGRLLLNVGPDRNGDIPIYQKAVLEELSKG